MVLHPSFAPAHTSLGKLFLFQKQTKKALIEFQKTLDLSPNDGDAFLGLARLEAQQAGQAGQGGGEGGREEGLRRAAELYGKAVGMEPTSGYESAWFDFGVVLSQLGRHEEAAEKFEQATALNENMMNFEMLGQVSPPSLPPSPFFGFFIFSSHFTVPPASAPTPQKCHNHVDNKKETK